MKIIKQNLFILPLLFAMVFSLIPMKGQALTYSELSQGKVLGDSMSYSYPSGSLVNDDGTIYFISGTTKIPFTNWQAFVGLGYTLRNVVNGDLQNYTPTQTYVISTANAPHPWGSWLLYNGTVYNSTQNGMIGVPSNDVFINNGGNWNYVVKANKYDINGLNFNATVPVLDYNDVRVYNPPFVSIIPPVQNQPTPTPPITTPSPATTTLQPTTTPAVTATPTPTSTPTSTSSPVANAPDVINTLNYFLNTSGKTLTGTHPLSQTVNGQTVYNVKWAIDSYETYTYDDNYIYLKEDHSGSPNPGSYTFSDGKWMKRAMQVGDQINLSGNIIQNFTVNSNSCAQSTSGAFPYAVTLQQHIPNYNLEGTLGTQDVIVLQYDYRNGTGTDYEKSYYAKGWGMVKWELYRNNKVIQTSIFNQVSTSAPTAPSLQVACINTPVTPLIPATLTDFVNLLYSCVAKNNNPDSSGFNNWLQNLQNGSLDIKGVYTQFYNVQNTLNPSLGNDMFTKLLYRCTLLRETDATSYNNVMTGLSNGTLTRSGLVQTVLNSSEFTTNILSKLQTLLPATSITQVTNPNEPTLPTSLNGLVSTLYSCVLNNTNPDSSGFNFWLNNLQTHALSIQGAYTQFFGYQSGVTPAINNNQFTKKLYGCILFRAAEQTSYSNIITGLTNGTLTQANLVQTVLNSSEFTTGILPKLQVLK